MSLATVECGARLFAKVHSEAHAIAPLLAQSFDVTFKGSDKAVKLLSELSIVSPSASNRGHHKFLAGKTIRVKVDWSTACFFHLRLDAPEFLSVMVSEEEFKEVIKQIGLAPKMFNVWKIAKRNRLMHAHL